MTTLPSYSRRLCFAFLASALFLSLFSLAQAQPAGKRSLTHADYDGWRSIQGQTLSADGKLLAYFLTPQEGDGEVVLRNLATGTEWRHTTGSRPPVTELPAQPQTGPRGAMPPGQPRGIRPYFTADGRYLVFAVAPAKAETEKAKKEKKRPEEMPKGMMGVMDTATGKVVRMERVKGFQVPEDGPALVACHREPAAEEVRVATKSEAPPAKTAASRRGRANGKKEPGSPLILRNLDDGRERTFADVSEYALSKDGKSLVYAVSSKNEAANGVYAVATASATLPVILASGKGRYLKLTWDESQTQLAFLSDRDDATAAQPKFKLYCWQRQAPATTVWPGGALPLGSMSFTGGADLLTWSLSALPAIRGNLGVEVASASSVGLRRGMGPSDRGTLSFSHDGGRLFFGVAVPLPPEKDENAAANEEKVIVDLWHWKDDYIQPMQKVRAEQERNRTFRAVVHLKEKKVVQLADADMADAIPTQDGMWALGSDDRSYRPLVGYDAVYHDFSLVNTRDGSRKPLVNKQQWGMTWSPAGGYALFYDGKNWNSIDRETGKVVNLTANLGVAFGGEEHDTPGVAPPYGNAGWTADDKHVLLYDRYDIWLIPADGGPARNVTLGFGRRDKVQYRYVRTDPDEKAIDPAKPLLVRLESEETRDTGFARVRLAGGSPELLLLAAKHYPAPIKAKKADVFVLTGATFHEFPDLLVTSSDFRDLKKVSTANPQQAGLLWGDAEMVRYQSTDGTPLKGVLLKPEGFDSAKKYPLLVYIYERLSQNLHHFVDPRPGTSINPTYYVSNGYLVFMPDIAYTVGAPGQSALKCVLPGIQAVVERGGVDEQAIGIQGHSWGGYQIAYLITQTNRFKAASAGAPVANMISAYDGIRWGTGLPRQWQYEKAQSRIGGSLWQFPMRFIENSPIFQADRVRTPLLMLHNDADDAVPWYQGIEYYLALRRLEKEVYLFNYNGELHGLRKRANQKDYTVRMQQFFDHHLKGAPKPAWMEKGVAYLEREK